MAILIFLVCVAIYFIPTYVGRDKKNVKAIFLLNLFLGWTLVGWVVALIWASVHEESEPLSFDKKCPFCAETIKAEALICRYCGKKIVTKENELGKQILRKAREL